MPQDTFLIANMEVGLERDREPWLLPAEAFPTLEDAYLFRGRIKRRRGYENLGRLITTVGAVDTINNLPVMGLRTRELGVINQEQLIAFDTTKANSYSTALSQFVDISFHTLPATNAFSWTGSDSDFFWTTNYANAFWTTNSTRGFQDTWNTTVGGQGDGIRWYDGTRWTNFLPQVDSTNYLMGATIIIPYRNRLVMLNTTEGTAYGAFTNYPQRARWSQNGTVFPTTDPLGNATQVPSGYTGGTDNDAWRSDIVGRGGYIDAPTSQQIIAAQFIRDTLIVFFERSTWQLTYTGDPTLPFIWQRVNVELGAESTFSIIPFDSGLVGIGNYGIISASNSEVFRIDQKIPDEVFNIHNGNDGVKRVYGIRDFANQLVYWTFPNDTTDPTFPTRVLVYDYLQKTYAIFNDSLTCFGYYQPFNDITWADLVQEWGETPISWNTGQLQSDYPLIVAGNQQGFVFARYNAGPIINDPSLYITGISQANPAVVTSPNHNLLEGTIIALSDVVGMTLAITGEAVGTAPAGSISFSGTLSHVAIEPSSVTITIGANVFVDNGSGDLTGGGTINYISGEFSVTFTALASATSVTADYTQTVNGKIFRVSPSNPANPNTFNLQVLDVNDNFVDYDSTTNTPYVSDGFIQVRNNINILTKKFNPFISGGYQVRLRQIDYFLEFSSGLEFTTDVFLDENNNQSVQSVVILPQTNILQKIWYPSFYSAIGQFIQMQIGFSPRQMFTPAESNGDITIHAFLLYLERAGRLSYGDIV